MILDLFPVLILVLISCIGVFVEVPHPFYCSSIFFSFYDYLARKKKKKKIFILVGKQCIESSLEDFG